MTINVLPHEYTPRSMRTVRHRETRKPRAYAVMVEPLDDPLAAGGVSGPFPTIDACLDYVPSSALLARGRVAVYQLGGPDPTDFPLYEWIESRGCWRRTSETRGSRGCAS